MHANISHLEHLFAYASRLDDIRLFSKVVRNWHDVVLFRAGAKKSITIVLRSGKSVPIRSRSDYTKFFGSVEFQRELLAAQGIKAEFSVRNGKVYIPYKGKRLSFIHKPSLNDLPSVIEQFAKEEYKDLHVKGRDVVDIGASIGDSSIYFAMNGARHVYAYEPYPYPFSIARKNVTANRLAGKITLINEGLGKKGDMTLAENEENTVGMPTTEAKSGKRIRINSLNDVVSRHRIKGGVLKVDCEGCEYSIILDADRKTLRSFTEIKIEYHYGYYNLVKKLESSGFSVKHTAPKMMEGPAGWRMHMGLITAHKVSKP